MLFTSRLTDRRVLVFKCIRLCKYNQPLIIVCILFCRWILEYLCALIMWNIMEYYSSWIFVIYYFFAQSSGSVKKKKKKQERCSDNNNNNNNDLLLLTNQYYGSLKENTIAYPRLNIYVFCHQFLADTSLSNANLMILVVHEIFFVSFLV